MKKEDVLALFRHVLTGVGTLLVARGYIDDGALQAAIGGILSVASVVWSLADKANTRAEILGLRVQAASLRDEVQTLSVK